MFTIQHLDHVAITCRDMAVSAQWYEEVLGLKKVQPEEWKPYPIFLLTGQTGVALFPEGKQLSKAAGQDCGIKIDHFAFRVDRANFAAALAHFERLGLDYVVKDHHYFHSVYLNDPDGHELELTTLVVEENEFFKN